MKFARLLVSSSLMLLLLLQLGASFSIAVQASTTSSKTLVVPDEYATISAAIGNASQGDTIYVKNGVYYENPTIDKAISVVGENSGQTTIIGTGGIARGEQPVFNITASDVTISGFTIETKNYTNTTYCATGINICGDNCLITGNNIVGTYQGIFCSVQSNLAIIQNTILSTQKEGIRICGGSNNTISDNTIALCGQSGIALDGFGDTITDNQLLSNYRGLGLGAPYSLIFGNNFSGNSESGLYMASSNSTIAANNMTNCKYGIYFTSYFAAPNNNTLYSNNIINNTQAAGTSSTFNIQIWDYNGQGNYWSDYNPANGSTSYTVYENNVDFHPLTVPYNLIQSAQAPAAPLLPSPINGTVSTWHFDEVEPNGATPDSVGNSPVILEPTGNTYTPVLVDGKFGKALQFNGTDYAYVTVSPTLQLQNAITIDAWINVQAYKANVAYNNILIECARTQNQFPTRILGFSINGQTPQNSSQPAVGALRGYFLDDEGVFNEIATSNYIVPLNQWVHVVFVRSLTTGMHIYVNGQEQQVEVTSGSQNPSTKIAGGCEFYIGHDSYSTIDELSVSTVAMPQETNQTMSVLMAWWFWATIIAGVAFLAAVFLFIRKSHVNSPT